MKRLPSVVTASPSDLSVRQPNAKPLVSFCLSLSLSLALCCRIYCEDKHSFLQDCEDDGETAAGGRLLHLLQVITFVRSAPVVQPLARRPPLCAARSPKESTKLFPVQDTQSFCIYSFFLFTFFSRRSVLISHSHC